MCKRWFTVAIIVLILAGLFGLCCRRLLVWQLRSLLSNLFFCGLLDCLLSNVSSLIRLVVCKRYALI